MGIGRCFHFMNFMSQNGCFLKTVLLTSVNFEQELHGLLCDSSMLT